MGILKQVEVKNNLKVEIVKTDNDNFPYNAQVGTYDNGNWVYAGNGKFCRTLEEVEEFKKKVLKD